MTEKFGMLIKETERRNFWEIINQLTKTYNLKHVERSIVENTLGEKFRVTLRFEKRYKLENEFYSTYEITLTLI